MIVTRAKAEEAKGLLEIPNPLEEIDGPLVYFSFKVAARRTHPDVGGNAEAFARVDWAKHVLLKWLEKPANAEQRSDLGAKCPHCEGYGYVRKQIGFKLGARIQCVRCAGTGDAGHEPDRPQGEY